MFLPERGFGEFFQNLWNKRKNEGQPVPDEMLHFATVDYTDARISFLVNELYGSGNFYDRFTAGALNARFHELLKVAATGQLYPIRKVGHFTSTTSGFTPEEAERKSSAIRQLVYEQAIDGNIGVLTKLSTIRLEQLVVEIGAKMSEMQVLAFTANCKDNAGMALYSSLQRDLWYLNDDSFSIGLIVDGLYPRIDYQDAHSLDPWQIFLNDPKYTLRIPSVFVKNLSQINLDPTKNP